MKHVSSMPMEMKKKMTVFSFSSDSSSLVKMRLSEMMTPAVPGGVGELSVQGPLESQPRDPHHPPLCECDASWYRGVTSSDFGVIKLLEDIPTASLAWQCRDLNTSKLPGLLGSTLRCP